MKFLLRGLRLEVGSFLLLSFSLPLTYIIIAGLCDRNMIGMGKFGEIRDKIIKLYLLKKTLLKVAALPLIEC